MNKTLILFLAVCLISVHAFVKRDAPEAPKNEILDNIQAQAQNMVNDLSKVFDPELIKKNLNEVINSVQSAVDSLKPKDVPKA